MSTLNFVYGTMKSGKTLTLLADAHNYRDLGRLPYLMTAAGDTRSGIGMIRSRIGIQARAETFSLNENLYEKVRKANEDMAIDVIMVDEAQFLTRDQVFELSDVVDDLGIKVTAYGLRTDFRGELFEGSAALMALADHMTENTGVCASGKIANMVLRIDADGHAMVDGPQVLVGGEETYEAVSRRIWKQRVRESMQATRKTAI